MNDLLSQMGQALSRGFEVFALFSIFGIAFHVTATESSGTALLAWFFVFLFVCWRLRAAELRHDEWRQQTSVNQHFSQRNVDPSRWRTRTRPGFFTYWFVMLCFFVALIISISIFPSVHFLLHLLAITALAIVGNLAFLYIKNRNA